MKKTSLLFNLMGVILCGLTTQATAADFCGQNYNDCCEWSFLDGKMTLGADWLYWKVQQDGVNPGFISSIDTTILPTTTNENRIHPKFKYESGYRVNLGYELPGDAWDMNVCYTYIPSHATRSFAAGDTGALFFQAAELGGATGLSAFSHKWDFTGNNIDFDIGRTVCFGETLNVRPHIGVRAAWWDQKFHSFGVNTTADITSAFTNAFKEKFQGYGVEGGLWADWGVGYGVSLVGHVGGSILYSRYTVHGTATTGTLAADGTTTLTAINNISDRVYIATPTMDYYIGLQYAGCLCDMLFKVHAGWEQHVFFDTNKYLTRGNLAAQGLTLGLDVGF
jgi:hypothetical protein